MQAQSAATEPGPVDTFEFDGNCTTIKASQTSPAHHPIKDFGRSVHTVCRPGGGTAPLGRNNKLFVLIPGIQPELYRWPVATAAEVGYDSIGISWFNKPASGGVCFESAWAKQTGQTNAHNATQEMATCAFQVMLMRLLGADDPRVPKPNKANFTIDSTNSIVGGVEALLATLVKDGEPQWAQYLTGAGKLNWPKVALAGHSRASGIMAAISKVPSIANVIDRGIAVGGPGDAVGNFSNLTATSQYWRPEWLTDIASNTTNFYSLDPAYTGGCWMTQPNLEAINISGMSSFDNATALMHDDSQVAKFFGGARQLYDQSVCLDAQQTHMCLGGGDQWMARSPDGTNMVAPIWRYMLTNEALPGAKALETKVACRCAQGPAHGPPWRQPAC
jgi:hypothetical protein